ncbi:MAG: nitroreductase, partial [Solirubrobacterales bacterium]
HAKGLGGYWRTPEVLRTAQGRAAVGLPDNERFVGLLHVGVPKQEQRPAERPSEVEAVEFLD